MVWVPYKETCSNHIVYKTRSTTSLTAVLVVTCNINETSTLDVARQKNTTAAGHPTTVDSIHQKSVLIWLPWIKIKTCTEI